ncbi:MAG: hypothetical protein SGJ02_01505, partial [bacterium]|nr:hypothetical protein [bacterium]
MLVNKYNNNKQRPNINSQKESGFVLIVITTSIFVMLFFIFSTLMSSFKIRQKNELSSEIISALNAASNTDQKQFIYQAACNSLRAVRFPSLDCTPKGGFENGDEASIASHTISTSDTITGHERCELQFDFTPRAATPSTPVRFCLQVGCEETGIFLPFTSIKDSASVGCISKPKAVAMVSIDMSSSLAAIYADGADPLMKIPPPPHVSSAILAVHSSNAATSYSSYYFNNGYPTNDAMLSELYNTLPIGVRDYFTPNTLTLADPTVELSGLPFSTKETDLVGALLMGSPQTPANSDYNAQSTGAYAGLYPMCSEVTPGSSDGNLDPIQFIHGSPFVANNNLAQQNSDFATIDWIFGNSTQDSTYLNEGLFTRGGDATRNFLTHSVFGPFVSAYKRAALQVIYTLGSQQVPTGVTLFSNWLTMLHPLLPTKAFDGATPILNWNIASQPVMGPAPAVLQAAGLIAAAPDGASFAGDYVAMQFQNNGAPDGDQLNYSTMQRVIHPMMYGQREMSNVISITPPSGPLTVTPSYYAALPNPFDPSMEVLPPSSTLLASKCIAGGSGAPIAYYPTEDQFFGAKGTCADRDDDTLYNDDPNLFRWLVSTGILPAYSDVTRISICDTSPASMNTSIIPPLQPDQP